MKSIFDIPANSELKTSFSNNTGIVEKRLNDSTFSSFVAVIFNQPPSSYNVTTIAGTGTYGDLNGIGVSAKFRSQYGIAIDSKGNIFVVDSNNLKIKMIDNTPAHNVTTIAGSGNYGDVNGIGTSAQFKLLQAIAIDTSGNLFFGDSNKIKKIDNTPAHNVTTIAGTGTYGNMNGVGISAKFGTPQGIAIDTSGNIFFTESSKIKMIDNTSAHNVSIIAGTGAGGDVNGIGTSAQFANPRGITIDSSGNLFVLDTKPADPYILNSAIFKIKKIDNTTVRNVTTIAGSTMGDINGVGSSAKFNYPLGITIDSKGNIFVADNGNNKIKKIDNTPAHSVTTIAGTGTQGDVIGSSISAKFSIPNGITVDITGNLFVTDDGNYKIKKITPVY